MTLSSCPLGLSLSPWDLMVCVQGGGVHATLSATKLWGKSSEAQLGRPDSSSTSLLYPTSAGVQGLSLPSVSPVYSVPGIPSLCL